MLFTFFHAELFSCMLHTCVDLITYDLLFFCTEVCCHRDTVCNGKIEDGCPDDDEWAAGTGFKCTRNGRVCRLPQQLLHDDVQDCEQGEDLCFDITAALG